MKVLSGFYQLLQLSRLEHMIESLPLLDTSLLLILRLPRDQDILRLELGPVLVDREPELPHTDLASLPVLLLLLFEVR